MAKKKYYQDVKDRMAESRGMEKYETKKKMKKKMKKEDGEYNERRPYESKDKFSFGNDYSAPQNMPTKVMMRNYPKSGYSVDGYYGDDLAGVDYQIDSDARDVKKNAKKGERY